MSATSQPATLRIGLPPEQFAAAFPFHFALDANLKFRQVGATLERICPDIRPGTELRQSFQALRPQGQISLEWIEQNQANFFLLEHRASHLLLRGEFMLLPGTEILLFLGSPWFTDPQEIVAHGLRFEDFAIHDPAVDLLQVFQANKISLEDAKRLAEKLKEQRAELRAVNARLRQQEAETKKLAITAERTDNAVVLTDAAGKIVWVNAGFTRIHGYTLADVLGKKPGSVLQGPGTDPQTIRRIGERIRQGEGFSEEILNYGKNGRSYWLAIEVQPIRDDSGQITNFMAIEADITVRRAAQQRLAIQFEVSRVLTEVHNLEVAVSRLLQAIGESLGWQVGLSWRAAGEYLRFMDVWNLPSASVPEFISASRSLEFRSGVGLPGRVWAAGKPAWIVDATDDPNFHRREMAAREGLHGVLAFPVLVRGKVWGVLEFFSRHIEEPDAYLLQTFAAVGNQIGQFIVRREAEEALRETSTLQNAILEGANYAIISTTNDGIIRVFNAASERMLGYLSQEVVGKATPAIFHDLSEVTARAAELTSELGRKVEPDFEAFVAKAALGKPDEREWTYIRKDGSRFPVRLSVTALFDDHRKITAYLGVASDITEQRRVASELVQAKEAAETANRAKSEFLAMMSHEIRTPMNAVLGMTNLLLQTPLDAKQTEFARMAARGGEALLEIINDILDFSKIEAGEHFQLEKELFRLPPLVEESIQLFRPRAEASGLELRLELASDLPPGLSSDAGRLRQVLMNLISNGIKFTTQGAVTVQVRPLLREANRARLRFEVRDTGMGMTPEDVSRLFQPFSQVGDSTAHRSGTGLGLAISKRIVELMGGTIGVESAPGHGSLFWFELEMEVAAELPPTANPVAAKTNFASASLTDQPLRILVAEDNETNRRLVMFMLEKLNCRADFAVNGQEAVAAWERSNYQVILMDCQMPQMDGFAATREIRRRETVRQTAPADRVHIIALTANALEGDRERCLAAQMDGFLSKPFSLEQLKQVLWRPPEISPEAPERPLAPAAALVVFEEEKLAQLCTDLGEANVCAIARDFLKELPKKVSRLQQLAADDEWPEFARTAHSLQGIMTTLGLGRLPVMLAHLEHATKAQQLDLVRTTLTELEVTASASATAIHRWLDGRSH